VHWLKRCHTANEIRKSTLGKKYVGSQGCLALDLGSPKVCSFFDRIS